MSTNLLDSFIFSENLCTGSQGDKFSNCILENLRFLPFTNDQFDSSFKDGSFCKQGLLPYLSGNTYVQLKPIAISNPIARMQQENDYGVVGFRCLDSFSRPLLSLPRLQDIGMQPKSLVVTEKFDTDSLATIVNSIPLKDPSQCQNDSDCLASTYIFNARNNLLAYSSQLNTILGLMTTIKTLILNSGNYYELPTLVSTTSDNLSILETRLASVISSLDSVLALQEPEYSYVKEIITTCKNIILSINLLSFSSGLITNVTNPIQLNINASTDFTTFNYNITQAIVDYISDINIELSQKQIFIAQQLLAVFGTPASVAITSEYNQKLYRSLIISNIYEIFNIATYILNKIQVLYSVSNVSQNIALISDNFAFYDLYKSFISLYSSVDSLLVDLVDSSGYTSKASDYSILLSKLDDFTGLFYIDSLVNSVTNIENSIGTPTEPEDLQDAYQEVIGNFYDSIGTASKITLSSIKAKIDSILVSNNTTSVTNPNVSPTVYSSSGQVMTINLGYSFKDKQKFYFADIAYAVGFGTLENIESITIGEELYLAESIIDSFGQPISGLSMSGCTRYTFNRKVLPTYEPEVEMFIYPGIPNQPYCPTVTKYHNYASCMYSGMFTKLLPEVEQNADNSLIGLYVFTNYKPMLGTVENLYQLGTININAINLNDPSLKDSSYEYMLQRQVVSLTNSSSLVKDGLITTDDLKYYFKASIADPTKASNLRNMAIVEFKNFPLGNALKAPDIVIKFKATDSLL